MSPLITTAAAWLWDKYGEDIINRAADAVKGQWKKFKWKDAAEKYRSKIKKLYGTMQIMGMTEAVPLNAIFTEVYIWDKPAASSRFDIERLKQLSTNPDAPPSQAKRIGGLTLVKRKVRRDVLRAGKIAAVEEDRNLFILGKPGAGKTTFLKYIALQAAEQNIDKIPIFINLKHWTDSRLDLMLFIAERFDICDFPNAEPFVEVLLKSGNAIVLFDGLDEVNREGEQRDKQAQAINNFVEKYDRTQCLITCRNAANDYSFQPFTYVEIADFTEGQIEKFVSSWFGEDEETYKRFMSEFERDDNKGLRDLARTPLLLTLLCIAFNETLTFPQRRVEIYQEALDALLKKWDSSRRIKRDEVYRKLSLGHKVNMMARIGATTFEKNEYFIPQAELEKLITEHVEKIPPHDPNEVIDGETIIKAIEVQNGIFAERAHRIYSFSHLTFQEYFTAKYVVDNAAKGTLTNLVKAHCTDGRWREVFLLTTSLLPDADQFMTIFRRGLDELLAGDERLIELLAWADRRATPVKAGPWLVRPYYLCIEHYFPNRSLTRALARTLARALDRIRARAGARVSARTRAIIVDLVNDLIVAADVGRNLVHALDLIRKFILDPRLDLDLALARDLTRARTRARVSGNVLDFTFVRAYDSNRDYASELGLNDLAKELGGLSKPHEDASASEWLKFSSELRALMIRHRDVGHDWNLTETQEERLVNYLDANILLQDCLELAFMPPDEKDRILNSLYLPPAQAEDRQMLEADDD